MKTKFSELTETGFNENTCWLVSEDLTAHSLNCTNVLEDSACLALCNYTLNDGTRLSGFFYIYEGSGFYVFYKKNKILVGDWPLVSRGEALGAAQQLGKKMVDIYPISYESPILLFDRVQKGKIEIDDDSFVALS